SISVTNVAPTASIVGAPATSTEGTKISVTSSVTDPGTDDFTYAWKVRKGNALYASGGGQNFKFTPADNGSYTVSLVVTDDDGGVSQTASKTITVNNANPTATFNVASTGFVGTPTPTTVTVNDIGSLDTETVTVDWGDGSTNDSFPAKSSDSLSPSHVYSNGGTFPVKVTVTDNDGGSSIVNSSITVKSYAIQQDPMDSTKTALVVMGGDGDDVIRFSQTADSGRIKAILNGVTLGT